MIKVGVTATWKTNPGEISSSCNGSDRTELSFTSNLDTHDGLVEVVVNGNFKTFRGSQVKGIIKGLRVKKERETILPSHLCAFLNVDVFPESFLFKVL